MRCAIFKGVYGWGRSDLVQVPPEWDAPRRADMKMGANTVWQFEDTDLEYANEAGAGVWFTRENSIIKVAIKDALILREYWVKNAR